MIFSIGQPKYHMLRQYPFDDSTFYVHHISNKYKMQNEIKSFSQVIRECVLHDPVTEYMIHKIVCAHEMECALCAPIRMQAVFIVNFL